MFQLLVLMKSRQMLPHSGQHLFELKRFFDVIENTVAHRFDRFLIRFGHGFRDDLDDFIGCFDLLVHPALAEGLGVAALKAAAAGVPVVGFDAGGLKEAVEHGKTGLLVALEDVDALRVAIASLIDDDQLRQQMGGAGRIRMQTEFSIATMADKHTELYESLL